MKVDLLYWLAFAAGQSLFMLKRTALAIRSPMNSMGSRTEYLKLNWDVLLIRSALEFAFIFYPYRHVPLASLLSFTGWNIPFAIPQSAVTVFILGFFSDAMMDWAAMQDKLFGKIPVPSWIKETIPQLPENVKLQKAIGKAVDAAEEAKDAAKATEVAVAKVQEIAPKP
jgi:hypothetical protein